MRGRAARDASTCSTWSRSATRRVVTGPAAWNSSEGHARPAPFREDATRPRAGGRRRRGSRPRNTLLGGSRRSSESPRPTTSSTERRRAYVRRVRRRQPSPTTEPSSPPSAHDRVGQRRRAGGLSARSSAADRPGLLVMLAGTLAFVVSTSSRGGLLRTTDGQALECPTAPTASTGYSTTPAGRVSSRRRSSRSRVLPASSRFIIASSGRAATPTRHHEAGRPRRPHRGRTSRSPRPRPWWRSTRRRQSGCSAGMASASRIALSTGRGQVSTSADRVSTSSTCANVDATS